MTGPVLSVCTKRLNADLIADHVVPLWITPDDFVMDVTYGRGKWWTKYRPPFFIAHDLHTLDRVDFRHLPEADDSVDVIAFDPPYIPPGGRETSTVKGMHAAYGMGTMPATVSETFELIADGIKECARVLAPNGRLLVKCQDFITSGKFQPAHDLVIGSALLSSLEQVDEFIHVTGTGPQPKFNLDGSPRRQVHSRRAHGFLCVFQKPATRKRLS